MDSAVAPLPDESGLVARATAEPVAFAAIYDHYFPRVYNYVRYRVREADTADDITSQVFEAALTKLGGYHPERAAFAVWLFVIARNAVNDYFRASHRRWLPLDLLQDHPDSRSQPEEVMLHDETHVELLAALARLSDQERDLIAMKFGAGLTNRHIAELSTLSESNVGVILYRAVRRLRAELGAKR